MNTVQTVVDAMQAIAPLCLAEPWDRVGVLVGRTIRALDGPVLLTIDLTEAVIEEASTRGAAAVISYHPPIWEPFKRLTDATPRERVIARAVRDDIAVYAPHTSLDNAPGCLTDWLCEGVSGSGTAGRIAGDCRALSPRARPSPTQECKVVTFIPAADADRLRQALATAGAGLIGRYSVCSFSVPGTGTFLASPEATPAVGRVGGLEHVQEIRLEMVCGRASLPLVLTTLRQFHPYEEPAFDVYDLAPRPDRFLGPGRRVVLDQPATIRQIAARIKAFLGNEGRHPSVHIAAPDPDRSVTHVGVVCGAGAEQASQARAENCEVFVTGEMKHHEVMEAINNGMAVILAGHTATERGYLPRLARRLGELIPGGEFLVSQADKDPLVAV
ncbi:MAG: Nif3-like dinuclear metal center hexameric protein [Phycisphaeraceae bacterium]|nr:Nif3-like dinuclear metal center hexameric protein [Phycisphaerae bacterium]MBX3393446.1 Nif3-like dinuclear metal center hexameric protein [Phycisphaeraceae bacterium]HRJ49453.1 Nif3-like dinuclear metal center hexameric protein [Phycisphaerales bacterium]